MFVKSSRIPGFYRLGLDARRQRVAELSGIDEEDLAVLDAGGLELDIADGMIENVIGTYALPMALALNFSVNTIDYLVPMVVEEPSVVAAASNAAKMVRAGGGFHARVSPPVMIGQVQLVQVPDPARACEDIMAEKEDLLQRARGMVPRLVERGGGPVDIRVRPLAEPGSPDGGMIVVHIHVDCRDAMGANTINSLAEGMADRLAFLSRGKPGLRILSNLSDTRTVSVMAQIPDRALDPNAGAQVRRAIIAASRFAELDPYRAATHNKGIMNGVDAVLLATGNDWRGVEAGAHAYACQDGRYRPLAEWSEAGGTLTGTLRMPLAVGTVGGALHIHRGAKLALRLLGVRSATELAGVAGAVGLASNLAALRALATDGIQRGHMSLHARVVARAAGATGELVEQVARELSALGDVSADRAKQILARLRRTGMADILKENR
ncbi:hydroxymethylglutaryl-CoA reductase, degradative [Haliangium sp.]|uniref:hydroxymethylglutaryl-CoA reductase, degradative n=1 Tax=Haliangium sp. TaxID=2663208 RepID=UPI003D13B9D7